MHVWEMAGGFETIGEWHPAVASLKMVEGEKEPRRLITLADGAIVDERLVELDDAKRSQTYTILESPIPLTNYFATISVQPEGAGSRITWSANYDPNPGQDATCVEIVSGIFESGLEALKQQLEG